jgi:sulfonate transport system substrate-binding protein
MNKWHFLSGILLSALLTGSALASDTLKTIRIGVADIGLGGKPVSGGNFFDTAQIKGSIDKEFAKDGIKVEWDFFKGAGPAVNEALANHQLDFAWQGDLPAIVARAGGLNTKLILATDTVTPQYLAVPVGSTVKSLEDLKGKKVAIFKGTNLQLLEIKAYKKLGLTEKDFKTINMDKSTMEAALATKDIDAGWFGPEVYSLVDKGIAQIIYNTPNQYPDLVRCSHVLVADEFEQAHPELVQRLVNVVLQEAAWGSDDSNRDANFQYWAQSGIPYLAYKRDFEGHSFKQRLSPLIDPFFIAHYQAAAAEARANHLIRQDVDITHWFEPKYLLQGLKTLHLEGFWQARDAQGQVISS